MGGIKVPASLLLKKYLSCRCLNSFTGYGLALMVEILYSILSGTAFATNIRRWGDLTKVANLVSNILAVLLFYEFNLYFEI